MRSMMLFAAVLGSLSGGACSEDEVGGDCGFLEPRRMLSADERISTYGPSAELYSQGYAAPDRLFFNTGPSLYLSDMCGEDVERVAADGLLHLSDEVALDCEAGVALRRGADDHFSPSFTGVSCSYLRTEEAILTTTTESAAVGAGVPLLLVDRRDPAVPITPLADRAIAPWSGFVGPRDVEVVEFSTDRVLSGHFSSPYLMLSADGRVLHVDRDDWSVAEVMQGVASLWPAPDGQAFAYSLKGAEGGVLVRSLAGGEAQQVAAAGELTEHVARPWWSVDGSRFAVSVGAPGMSRDRLLTLASGELEDAPAQATVMRELGAEGVWVVEEDAKGEREVYWEPDTGVYRELLTHKEIPRRNRRATADAIELVLVAEDLGGPEDQAGQLVRVPIDGSAPAILGEGVYPYYTLLEDGRIITHRPLDGAGGADDRARLIVLDPASGEEETIDSAVVRVRHGTERRHHRVIGDLLTWVVDDGARSGVWAVWVHSL